MHQGRRGGSLCPVRRGLQDSFEGGREGGNEVIDIFCADGKADGVGLDALIQQLFVGQLAVGGGVPVFRRKVL